jgi:hypothetical protein
MELVRYRTLPQGLSGKAIDYALKRWEALTRFVNDGVLEIDSNLIEELDSPVRSGKKEFFVHRASRSRGTERGDLHLAGQLSAARDQSLRVSEGYVHQAAGS